MRIKTGFDSTPSHTNNIQSERKIRKDVQTVPVAIYKDLLGNHEIVVRWNALRLVAHLRDLKTGSEIDNLPLIGVPQQLFQTHNLHRIQAFVQQCHLIPERSIEGTYNRVAVHVTARGGQGEGKIPFETDLKLGSIVDGQTLEKVEKNAEIVAEKQSLEDQIRFCEEKIEALLIQKEARLAQKPAGKTPDVLIKIWDAEIEKLTAFIAAQGVKLAALNEQPPTFSTFGIKAASPVDMEASIFQNQPKGFESIRFAEKYVRMSDSNAEIHNTVKQSTSAVTASADAGYLMWKAGAKFARAAALANTVLQIKKEGKAQGILIINAVATLKHVRCITKLKYDPAKLKQILQVMQRNNPDELKAYGIRSAPNGEKALCILTQAVMGASFTALVTFQDENNLNRNAAIAQKETNTQLATHLEGGIYSLKEPLKPPFLLAMLQKMNRISCAQKSSLKSILKSMPKGHFRNLKETS